MRYGADPVHRVRESKAAQPVLGCSTFPRHWSVASLDLPEESASDLKDSSSPASGTGNTSEAVAPGANAEVEERWSEPHLASFCTRWVILICDDRAPQFIAQVFEAIHQMPQRTCQMLSKQVPRLSWIAGERDWPPNYASARITRNTRPGLNRGCSPAGGEPMLAG